MHVVDLALACCALESQSALDARQRVDVTSLPGDTTVVLTLSGTITHAMAPAVQAALAALPEPPVVVAFGACACVGGPYWDSYAVAKGAGEFVAVDHFIAGCPPPPAAFAEILEEVRGG